MPMHTIIQQQRKALHHSAAAQSPGPHPGAGGPLPQRVHRRREQVGKRGIT